MANSEEKKIVYFTKRLNANTVSIILDTITNMSTVPLHLVSISLIQDSFEKKN